MANYPVTQAYDDTESLSDGQNKIDDAYINRTLASQPTWALWAIGAVILIGIAALVYQYIVFHQTPSAMPSPIRSPLQPKSDEGSFTLSPHQADEKLFWTITNIELLVPGAITAILAWLTYSLISKTIVALELTRRQAEVAGLALTEQRRETLRQHEPYVSINAFSVLVEPTKRALFNVDIFTFENINRDLTILTEIAKTSYSVHGNENDFQESRIKDWPESISLTKAWTLTIDITNVGLGAAHTIIVRTKPFTWMHDEVVDPNSNTSPFRKVQFENNAIEYPDNYDENRIPISISFSRELTVLPPNAKQTVTLEAKTWPRMVVQPVSGTSLYPTAYYPCDGVDLEISYQNFGSDETRTECTSIYISESNRTLGQISELLLDHIETYRARNPVFGVSSDLIFCYTSRPIDRTGDTLIAQALSEALTVQLEKFDEEETLRYVADSTGYAEKWILYDGVSYSDPDFRRFISTLIKHDTIFSASVDAFVKKKLALLIKSRPVISTSSSDSSNLWHPAKDENGLDEVIL